MRYALLGTTVLCAFAVATYACGGDDDNASIPEADAGSSSSTGGLSSSSSTGGLSSSSSSTGGSSTSSTSSSSGSSGTSGNPVTPADAGEVDDASSIPDSGGLIPDSGTTFDGAAGTLCQVNSVQEHEDNGTSGTANPIPAKTGTFCGSVSGTADKDFITFTLPADAVTLDISTQNSGTGFQLSGTVNGTTFALQGADAGNFPFVAGGTYTLEASSTSATSLDYVIGITITEQPVQSLCEATSTAEVEPNDTDTNATPATVAQDGTVSFCGVVSSTTDVDEFKFTFPTGYTHIATSVTGKGGPQGSLHITATDKGTAFDPNGNAIPLNAGDPYIFKFTSDTANNSYIYKITLTK